MSVYVFYRWRGRFVNVQALTLPGAYPWETRPCPRVYARCACATTGFRAAAWQHQMFSDMPLCA
jgi:hypothetical protein